MVSTLILGGTRSGKSRLAEQIANDSKLAVTYIATATAGDDEMQLRISEHQSRRPKDWLLIEEPIHLADALIKSASNDVCLLVDCLTLWLSNALFDETANYANEKQALLDCLTTLPGEIIFVTNETNMGVTPMGAVSRQFCDEAGLLHQQIATLSEHVILTVAGLPHYLKGTA